MKRILSLVLALVMVFGTIMPAFAETSTTKTSGEMLEEYGLIAGTGNGLEEDRPLKRSEMAVILAKLNNKSNIASAYAFPSSFTDVPATAWYSKWVAYAEVQNWMVGDATGGTFRPETYLSAQEVNILMVKALGYTDTKWEDANSKAEELKIAVNSKNANLVLRGDIFKAMTDTLDVPKKGEKDVLGTTLALKGYAEPTADTPDTLEVSKVIVDNRKTIVIEFNQELLKKSVNTTNFKVANLVVSKVLLSEDKKTVTLDMSSAIAQSKEIEIEITKVKDVTDKKTMANYKEKFVVTDVTIPVIESISVIDAKHVKIQASEPMSFAYSAYTVLPGVKIDGNAVIGKVVADNQNHTYTIELNSPKKEGSYKMILEGLKDYSGLSAVKTEFSFDVVKDDAAPVAVSAKSASVTVVEITFDEPLQTIGTVTINGKSTTVTYKADSNQKIVLATLSSADRLNLGATVEVVVKYKGQKDVVGNEVKTESTMTFKVEDDTALPSVALEVNAGNKMVFTFSKAMDVTLGKILVLDKDKKVKKDVPVTGLGTWNTDKTELTILAADLSTSSYNIASTNPMETFLKLEGLKDSTVRSNLLATIEMSITLLDTKKPTVSAYYVKKSGTDTTNVGKDDTITFFFSEMMDEDSLKNLSNYLKAGTTPISSISGAAFKSLATDMKSVTITYPQARSLTTADADKFVVVAVKDNAGNMIATDITNKIIMSDAGVALNMVSDAEAVKNTQVKVTFPVEIKTIDPAAIAIYKGAEAFTTVSSIASVDGKVVTLNLVKALPTDANSYSVKVVGPSLIISTYDAIFAKVANSTSDVRSITDKVAPMVTSLDDGLWNGSVFVPTKNKAVIKMSEAVENAEFVKSNLVVKLNDKILSDADYTILHVANTVYYNVTVNATEKVTSDGVYTLSVQLVRDSTNVKDTSAAHNVLEPFTKTITDFDYDYVAPSATAEYRDDSGNGSIDQIIVTATGGNITEAVEADFTVAGGDITSIDAISVTGNVVTLTVTGQVDATSTTDTLAWAADAFKINGIAVPVRTATAMTDKALPQVKSLAVASTHGTPTIAKIGDSVVYTMTFTENVTTAVVSASDINNIAGAVTTDLNAVNAASDTIEFTVASGDTGAVLLNALNFTITDANSNAATYATHGAVTAHSGAVTGAVTVDGVAPTVNVTADLTAVNNADTVVFTAVFSEVVTGTPQITLSGGETLAAVNMVGAGTTWTLTHPMDDTGNSIVQAQITVATDAVGNAVTGTFTTATNTTVVADNVVPTLDSVTTADTDNDGKIEYTLTFSEAILDSSFVSTDFLVKDTVTDLTGLGGTANDAVYVIEANAVDTDAMSIAYVQGTLTDAAGNLVPSKPTTTDATDTVAPVIKGIALTTPGVNKLFDEQSDVMQITFSEDIAAIATEDLTLAELTTLLAVYDFDGTTPIVLASGGAPLFTTVAAGTDGILSITIKAASADLTTGIDFTTISIDKMNLKTHVVKGVKIIADKSVTPSANNAVPNTAVVPVTGQ